MCRRGQTTTLAARPLRQPSAAGGADHEAVCNLTPSDARGRGDVTGRRRADRRDASLGTDGGRRPAAGTLRFEEMLAWTGPETGVVDRTVRLTPATVPAASSR